jgi:drug/metabolite transporter (DMT)-like permease
VSRRVQADLLLLVCCFFWGATFVVVQQALHDASTLVFLALRFSIGGVTLAAGAALAGRRWPSHALAASAAVGFFLFLGYVMQTQGLRWTTPSKSAFITGLGIVLVPLAASLVSRRPPGWGVTGGVALAVAGLALLTNWTPGASINRGDLWTLGGAVAFAVHILLVGRYSAAVPAHALATGQVLVGALLAAATFPWAEDYFVRASPRLWTAVLITGLLCTALGFFAQAWAQRFTSPAHTALIFSSEPVFAALTSAVVLGERLGLKGTAGALLILAGILVAEWRSGNPPPGEAVLR